MRKAKINQKYLSKLPILFIINIPNEKHLQFLDLMQTLRQLKDNKQPKHTNDGVTGGYIQQEDEETDEIDHEGFAEIVGDDLFDYDDLLACLGFY